MPGKQWNGKDGARPKEKITFTPELLEQFGASGKTHAELAKDHGIHKSLISRAINLNLTNSEAYKRGKQQWLKSKMR